MISKNQQSELGDFTTSLRVIPISGLAVVIGAICAFVALALLRPIGALLQGSVTTKNILGVLLVKWFIWAVSLGSGTSGGVLAPLLMMGGALGGLEAPVLPNAGAGFWPVISMGAILAGTMRSPLTGIVFAFELTHDANVFLPLLVAGIMAHAFTVLTLKRSILTEKVARRGFHLSREYAVDPLELNYVREVMRTSIAVFPPSRKVRDILHSLRIDLRHKQRLIVVVEKDGKLAGVATRGELFEKIERNQQAILDRPLSEVVQLAAAVANPNETLRSVVYRMAESGFTRMPVVERETDKLVGLVALDDLLKARSRHLAEEQRRDRPLKLRFLLPGANAAEEAETTAVH